MKVIRDVISGANVWQVGMDVRVKFGDYRSNSSRDIRLSHFARTTMTTTMTQDPTTIAAFCLKTVYREPSALDSERVDV